MPSPGKPWLGVTRNENVADTGTRESWGQAVWALEKPRHPFTFKWEQGHCFQLGEVGLLRCTIFAHSHLCSDPRKAWPFP